MSSTDTETQATPTPVQASNAAASLPGAGGASAAYGGASSSAPSATAAPAGASEPYSTMTTPTQVGVPNPQARPVLLGKEARTKDDYAGPVDVQPAVKAGGPAVIEYNIQDRTSAKGMQPQAIAQLNAAAEFAGQAGLSRIVVVAGRGPGHKSHGAGTEWDLMGYNADGSKWTREQRVAVASGARSAGATRFGFYEYGKSFPTADGRLHIGSRGPAATWGAGTYTSGPKSRAYTNEAERAFSAAFYAGQDFDYTPFLGQRPTMTAEAQNQPGTVAYAGDPFGVSASKAAAGIPNPPPRPVPASALAFAEAAPAAADPTRQILSTASLSTQVLDRGRVLDRGARGAATIEWQTFLNMHGFTDASGRQLTADGDFGRRTREATKAFQEWAQIGVDGRVGPETLSAALYTIDPTSAPMPGKVAYGDGAAAAKKIIAPAEVDMPAYRPRPERGAGIPEPRLKPVKAADLTPEQIDELTRVDANGNYVHGPGRPLPTEGLAVEPGRMNEARLTEFYANYERFRRADDARRAGERASRQRLSEPRTKDDRFRPVARDTRSQDDVMLVRSSEAVREFARGVGDSYRQVTAAARFAPMGRGQTPPLSPAETIVRVQKQIDDALLRVAPTPAETVTDTYTFGPFAPMDRADRSRRAAEDLRRRMQEAGIPVS